jgi:hypothetical protein
MKTTFQHQWAMHAPVAGNNKLAIISNYVITFFGIYRLLFSLMRCAIWCLFSYILDLTTQNILCIYGAGM